MMLAVIALFAVAGGFVQTLTGFGAGVILMTVLPYVFGVIRAGALNATVCLGLNAVLAYQHRGRLDWKKIIVPGIFYIVGTAIGIRLAGDLDLTFLTILFGLFLVAMAVYCLAYAKKAVIRPTLPAAFLCCGVSGLFAGLFGIGGPLMALYFVQTTDDHDSYIASLQTVFTVNGCLSLIQRVSRGFYTADLIPYTLVGLVLVFIGKFFGQKSARKIDVETFKKTVYAFVGISGVVTIVQQLLK